MQTDFFGTEEKQELFVCMAYVLRNAPPALLRAYWRRNCRFSQESGIDIPFPSLSTLTKFKREERPSSQAKLSGLGTSTSNLISEVIAEGEENSDDDDDDDVPLKSASTPTKHHRKESSSLWDSPDLKLRSNHFPVGASASAGGGGSSMDTEKASAEDPAFRVSPLQESDAIVDLDKAAQPLYTEQMGESRNAHKLVGRVPITEFEVGGVDCRLLRFLRVLEESLEHFAFPGTAELEDKYASGDVKLLGLDDKNKGKLAALGGMLGGRTMAGGSLKYQRKASATPLPPPPSVSRFSMKGMSRASVSKDQAAPANKGSITRSWASKLNKGGLPKGPGKQEEAKDILETCTRRQATEIPRVVLHAVMTIVDDMEDILHSAGKVILEEFKIDQTGEDDAAVALTKKSKKHFATYLFRGVMKILLRMLRVNQSDEFLLVYFDALRKFLKRFRGSVFIEDSSLNTFGMSFCTREWCFQILRYCNWKSEAVRTRACMFLCQVIHSSWCEKGNISQLRQALAASLGNVVELECEIEIGLYKKKNKKAAGLVPEDMKYCVDTGFQGLSTTFNDIITCRQQIPHADVLLMMADDKIDLTSELAKALKKVLVCCLENEIRKRCSGPTRRISTDGMLSMDPHEAESAMRMMDVAMWFDPHELPRCRLQWLDTLCEFQRNRNLNAEAACCRMLQFEAMVETQKKWAPLEDKIVLRKEKDRKTQAYLDKLESIQAWQYNNALRKEKISTMESCVAYWENGEVWEESSRAYRILLSLYEEADDYDSQIRAHEKCAVTLRKIPTLKKDFRQLGTYFRIIVSTSDGVNYDLLKNLVDREWVYKEPSITRLAEVTDRMKGLIQKITGTETKVEVVGDSKPLLGGDGGVQVRPRGHTKQLTIGSLDASTVVQLQVVALEPYFEEDEMAMREHSYLKQRHVIKRFMYSSPFTKSGKAYGSTQTQFRRNFVLEVEHPFPYTLVRQRVKSRSTVDLSPIECSIQDIVKRVTHLQSEIDKAEALRKDLLKIDTRSITQILQGSVMMQVHGGVLEVECFAMCACVALVVL